MADHARDKDTAAWLSREYSGSETPSLYIVSGNSEPVELPWQKVQRRIAQLIQQGMFYTEEERQHQSNLEAETRVDEMLAAAERIAAESAWNRMSVAVIETDEGMPYGTIHDGYYVDEDGVTEFHK